MPIIDSYSESNKNATIILDNGDYDGVCQSFTNTSASTLDSCKLYLYKSGSPTGNCYAKIYAHSGTYGTSSVPTGDVLATSEALDVTTISNSVFELKTFSFTGANRISLSATTYYVLTISFGGGPGYFDGIYVGIDSSSPTHDGNAGSLLGTTWSALSGNDACFYVYSASSGPANLKSYNTNLKANIKSINTNAIANTKTLNTNA